MEDLQYVLVVPSGLEALGRVDPWPGARRKSDTATRRIPPRPAHLQGFKVHPRRWVVERKFGWLVSYRRLGKDYERHTETSEAMIYAAMIHLMLRRLPPLP